MSSSGSPEPTGAADMYLNLFPMIGHHHDMNAFHATVLSKVVREPEALEYIKYVIVTSLSGGNKTCDFIINHGIGSNGKSTLLECTANTLTDCYVRKIPKDTFDDQ
jgi:hypothetical protein